MPSFETIERTINSVANYSQDKYYMADFNPRSRWHWPLKIEIEEFRKLSDYYPQAQDRYMISNFGRLLDTTTGYCVSPQINKGYYETSLALKEKDPITGFSKRIRIGMHRLVGLAFLQTPENVNEMVINHKDCDPENNWPDNLEWVTPSENSKYVYTDGARINWHGENVNFSKFSESDVRIACQCMENGIISTKDIMKYGFNITDCDEKTYNMYKNFFTNLKNRSTWTHITKEYSIPYTKPVNKETMSDENVHKCCQYMQDNPNNSTYDLIKDVYGITDRSSKEYKNILSRINVIRRGLTHVDISSQYKIWPHGYR